MTSRRFIQIVIALALLVGISWFIYKPDFEPALTSLCIAATLVGLIFEEKKSAERAADKTIFDKLKKALPSNGSIEFINQHNMAGWAFRRSRLDYLWTFMNEWNNPEHEFLNSKLEEKRNKLYEKIKEYLHLIASETFATNNPEWCSVPEEWEVEQPERFERVVNQLHNLAGEIVEKHQDLLRSARKHLKC